MILKELINRINYLLPLKEIQQNKLLSDFIKYLNFIKEEKPELTQTKNLKLKEIEKIKQLFNLPKHLINERYRIKSQMDWPHLDYIDTLVRILKTAVCRKHHLTLSKLGKEYLISSPARQYIMLFLTYWQVLNWCYLFPYKENDKENPAYKMQAHQFHILADLVDFIKDKDNWTDFKEFAVFIREKYDLKQFNYLNESLPERVIDCIKDVLIDPFKDFGIFQLKYKEKQIDKFKHEKLDKFQITGLGKAFFNLLFKDYDELCNMMYKFD